MTEIQFDEMVTLPEGYTARSVVLSDCETIAELCNTVSIEQFGKEEFTAEQVHDDLTSPDFDLVRSTRVVFTPDEKMIGYVEVWDRSSNPVRPNVWMRIHPDYANSEVGLWIMHWAEERAKQAIEKCPPYAMVAYHTTCKTGYEPMESLFEQTGLQLARYFYHMLIEMDSPPPQPTFPEGVTLRTYRHDQDLPMVLQADSDIFRDHWGYFDIPIDEKVKIWRHEIESREDFDENIWFLAMDDATEKIAGVALNFMTWKSDPELAYVGDLGVQREWRRKGLGLALLQHTFREFWLRDRRKVSLHVDADSLTGATRLYEKAGMHIHRQISMYEKVIRDGIDTTTVSVND